MTNGKPHILRGPPMVRFRNGTPNAEKQRIYGLMKERDALRAALREATEALKLSFLQINGTRIKSSLRTRFPLWQERSDER